MFGRSRGVFRSLNAHEVKYLLIGGLAAITHGVPRSTTDVDIVIEPSPENAQRLLDALEDAGFGTASLTSAQEIVANEITVFKDRIRLDVQTATPGLKFEEAWQRRVTVSNAGGEFHVVCREDLIASKLAAGRAIDLEDVRALRAGEAGADSTTPPEL
jgi:hypothetical protein